MNKYKHLTLQERSTIKLLLDAFSSFKVERSFFISTLNYFLNNKYCDRRKIQLKREYIE